MTKEEKDLAWLLLQPGHYMIPSVNRNGKKIFKVFEGRQVPVQYFTTAQVRRYRELFKHDHKNKITLNLNKVRQLNGKNYLKVLYKKYRANENKQESKIETQEATNQETIQKII